MNEIKNVEEIITKIKNQEIKTIKKIRMISIEKEVQDYIR
jgi:hypothetical protein